MNREKEIEELKKERDEWKELFELMKKERDEWKELFELMKKERDDSDKKLMEALLKLAGG